MSTVLLDDVIYTDYGQFDIVYSDDGGFDGDADPYFTGQANGWVGAASLDGIYVVLGRRSGGSRLRIILVDHQPVTDSTWEDVVESRQRCLQPASWAGCHGPVSREARSPASRGVPAARQREGPGRRCRHELADQVLDEYLLEFWRASPGPDTVIKTTSEDAELLERDLGGGTSRDIRWTARGFGWCPLMLLIVRGSGSPLCQDAAGSGVLGLVLDGFGCGFSEELVWGCEPAALESESLPRCPPGPVPELFAACAAASSSMVR